MQEVDQGKTFAPQSVKAKRVGKDLHITFADDTAADVIIQDYYDVMPDGYNGVIGQGENGAYYEYVPEDPTAKGLIPSLADGGQGVNVALGGQEVQGAGAALAVLAFNPLLAALGAVGAAGAAAAASNNSGGAAGTLLDLSKISATDDVPAYVGTLANGGSTNDTKPTLSGVGTAGHTVKVYDNGQLIGSSTVGSDGKWSFTPATELAQGNHALTFTDTPAGGTEGPAAGPYSLIVDSTAPTAPATSTVTDDVGSIQGPIANNGTTDDTQPTFSGTGTAGDVVKIYDGSTVIGSATVGADGKYSITP
ncbi:MAG: Ig-like domain-containing protein, partial [Limnohabitans sp.]